jgi:hypothetical protein
MGTDASRPADRPVSKRKEEGRGGATPLPPGNPPGEKLWLRRNVKRKRKNP